MNVDCEARINAELAVLEPGVASLIVGPPAVVIYRNLPTALLDRLPTDVAVQVPGGYPASMIDYAFLPEQSPLRGVVKGVPEEAAILVEGRRFKRVSYHPHNGGGGPPWDPAVHGFHTYIDELLTWLGVGR